MTHAELLRLARERGAGPLEALLLAYRALSEGAGCEEAMDRCHDEICNLTSDRAFEGFVAFGCTRKDVGELMLRFYEYCVCGHHRDSHRDERGRFQRWCEADDAWGPCRCPGWSKRLKIKVPPKDKP